MEELISKYFSGEASKSEEEEVVKWRNNSPDNSRLFFQYKKVWLETAKVDKPNSDLLNSILESNKQLDPVEVIPIWNTNLFRFAAVLIIGLGLIFSIYQYLSQPEFGDYVSTKEIILPDGSLVVTHDDAQLEILEFDNVRKVKLIGKAYFDISRDENKPFLIETENAIVKVLGTSFVVDSEDNSDEVLVESGVVSFSSKNSDENIKLIKGERAKLEKSTGKILKAEVVNGNYLSWRTHEIEFKKASLKEVFELLEDVYHVDLIYENVKLGDCQLTATFHNKQIDEIAKIISTTFNWSYSVKRNKITFVGAGCN